MADERVTKIDGAIEEAVRAIAGVSPDQRSEDLVRLEEAIAFARVSLYATEPGLITASTGESLWTAAQLIADDFDPHVRDDPASYLERLITATLLLPATRGRDVEQTVKEAAATYQRAMSQRIKALEDQARATGKAMSATEQRIDEVAGGLTATFDEKADQIQGQLSTLADSIDGHQAALDSQLTRHTEAFDASQSEKVGELPAADPGVHWQARHGDYASRESR